MRIKTKGKKFKAWMLSLTDLEGSTHIVLQFSRKDKRFLAGKIRPVEIKLLD